MQCRHRGQSPNCSPRLFPQKCTLPKLYPNLSAKSVPALSGEAEAEVCAEQVAAAVGLHAIVHHHPPQTPLCNLPVTRAAREESHGPVSTQVRVKQ